MASMATLWCSIVQACHAAQVPAAQITVTAADLDLAAGELSLFNGIGLVPKPSEATMLASCIVLGIDPGGFAPFVESCASIFATPSVSLADNAVEAQFVVPGVWAQPSARPDPSAAPSAAAVAAGMECFALIVRARGDVLTPPIVAVARKYKAAQPTWVPGG